MFKRYLELQEPAKDLSYLLYTFSSTRFQSRWKYHRIYLTSSSIDYCRYGNNLSPEQTTVEGEIVDEEMDRLLFS
jgi:hypothetical protein